MLDLSYNILRYSLLLKVHMKNGCHHHGNRFFLTIETLGGHYSFSEGWNNGITFF